MAGRTWLFLLLMLSALAASSAAAESAPPFDWRGFYLGYHAGGALDLADVHDPFGASIFGDTVRTSGPLAGGQIGYNFQSGAALFGVEADVSFADLDGTNTCFAFSGYYLSANCRVHVDALGTLAGRFGWTVFDDRTLIFGKAGLAWAHVDTDADPNGAFGLAGTDHNGVEWGWTIGAGIERAVTPRWTVKAEYGFLSFDENFAAPGSLTQSLPPGPTLVAAPGARTDVSHDIHNLKVGVNYKLGSGGGARPLSRPVASANGYVVTAGARYVYGWGQFHKDLGIQGRGVASLASRLTYDDDGTHGGEAFARLDTPFGLMVKGLIGGADDGGHLNDEDWSLTTLTAFVPYSNTLSQVDNDIEYGIVDIGYTLWRGERYSVAPFAGYTQFRQDMAGLGCRQIANRFSDCFPALPNTLRGITEDDTWQALRLGVVAETQIAPRLTLTGDAAYLPYVDFEGVDDHILRNLVSPEDGTGTGVQLEASLSYALTEALSFGIGGRYWAMWTTDGDVDFGGIGVIVPMRYAAEQAHLLVQGSYKFGVGTSPQSTLK